MFLYDLLIAPFIEFPFMRRALVGGVAVSLGAAPIGLFLMLRRMSLIGDAMAHAILPGAALGFLIGGLSLGAMTLGGLVAGLGVALLAGLVSRTTLVKEDMALAAFYLLSLATGVLILSGSGSNIDVLSLLFGSILALDDPTLLLIVSVSSLTLAALAVGYRGILMECLDPGFAAGVSRQGALFHFGFLIFVVLNLVAGFHALGTLLVVGIMML
ncbi:MAG: metal ABC transporter permease, partial [Rhabdaerophilum sp.]